VLSEAEKRLIEHRLSMISDAGLVEWARDCVAGNHAGGDDALIIELASIPPARRDLLSEAGTLLEATVRGANPDFDPTSSEAEDHARRAFVRHVQQLLDGDLSIHQFCVAITPIEESFDFPRWLGDFFDKCDWSEPDSQAHTFPHLFDYARKYLDAEGPPNSA